MLRWGQVSLQLSTLFDWLSAEPGAALEQGGQFWPSLRLCFWAAFPLGFLAAVGPAAFCIRRLGVLPSVGC